MHDFWHFRFFDCCQFSIFWNVRFFCFFENSTLSNFQVLRPPRRRRTIRRARFQCRNQLSWVDLNSNLRFPEKNIFVWPASTINDTALYDCHHTVNGSFQSINDCLQAISDGVHAISDGFQAMMMASKYPMVAPKPPPATSKPATLTGWA